MSTQSTAIHSGVEAEDTAFGLSATLAAAIAYILPVVGLIVLFTEDDNEFLRFNAAQSVALGVGLLVVRFAISFTLSLLGTIIAVLTTPLIMLFNFGILAVLLFMAYKASSGTTVELPVVADIGRSIEQAV